MKEMLSKTFGMCHTWHLSCKQSKKCAFSNTMRGPATQTKQNDFCKSIPNPFRLQDLFVANETFCSLIVHIYQPQLIPHSENF